MEVSGESQNPLFCSGPGLCFFYFLCWRFSAPRKYRFLRKHTCDDRDDSVELLIVSVFLITCTLCAPGRGEFMVLQQSCYLFILVLEISMKTYSFSSTHMIHSMLRWEVGF